MFKQKKAAKQASNNKANFRRNQTISGYKRIHDDNQPSLRQKTHAKNRLRRKIVITLALLAFVSAAGLFLLAQFISKIDLTTDNGSVATATLGKHANNYEKLVADYFSKNPLDRLNFVLKPDSLLLYLQQQAPEIEQAEIRDLHGLPGRATLYLGFRKPVAKWTIKNQDYYVDGAGKTFLNNYYGLPALTVVDENNLNIKQGVTIASNRLLQTIGQSVDGLSKVGLRVTKVTIPRGMTRQFNLSIDGLPYYVKLSTDRTAAGQTKDIKSVVDYLRLSNISPSYVDVRVAGKAYYK
ncbi:hypothetical protein FWF48_03310 [Candidatus Saccharibacteria bacterium]|nr:hypothetical protein [Candidatus Saccharibacteria bacterium]